MYSEDSESCLVYYGPGAHRISGIADITQYHQELIEPAREHVTTYTAKFKHGGFYQP